MPALTLLALAAGCSSGGGDDLGDPLPTSSAPETDATTALFTDLGKSFLDSGAGEAGSTLVGWALGALGIAGSDGTGMALAAIESTLQDIDMQLMQIAVELQKLISDEVVANCQDLSAELSSDLGKIDNDLLAYCTIICTGNGTCPDGNPASNVSLSNLMNFVDKVLDLSGGGQNSADTILDRINQALVGGTQGGIITACINPEIPGLSIPVDGQWNDADYYTRAHPVAGFYYYYQTVATFLYCEAQRFQAYITAGMPDSSQVAPEDINDFLLSSTDPDVEYIMNQTATRMQRTWDNLRHQFNLVGAPYTNEQLVLRYSPSAPRVYALDLDAFTTAAGESCGDLTTDNLECSSIVRGRYDLSNAPLAKVSYGGQPGGWVFADIQDYVNIMEGWSGGSAVSYMSLNNGTTTRGFQNMDQKVLLMNTVVTAHNEVGTPPLNTGWEQDFVAHMFTETTYGQDHLYGILPIASGPGLLSDVLLSKDSNIEEMDVTGLYKPTTFFSCQGKLNLTHLPTHANWSTVPGWDPTNTSAGSYGFHLPMIYVENLTPNAGLNAVNAAGAATMCTDDFEAWFAAIVPPPFP